MGKFVDKILKYKDDDLYVTFYSSRCGYSMRLLDFYKSNKIKFKAYDVEKKPNRFQKLLKDLNENKKKIGFDENHKTKPIVFYKGNFIGGSDDTIKLLSK